MAAAAAPAGAASTSVKRRVFKKESYDEKLALYMPYRDIIEEDGTTDFVEAVVFIHEDLIKDNQKVFISFSCDFKYDSEDWEALGVEFERPLFSRVEQIFPPTNPPELSSFQRKMIRKLGDKNAFAVTFDLPCGLPTSVMLMPLSQTHTTDPANIKRNCGVFYSLVCYPGASKEERPHKKKTARFALRKHTVIKTVPASPPSVQTDKKTKITQNEVILNAALNKDCYSHGQSVEVKVKVSNDAHRSIKDIRVELVQVIDMRVSDHAAPFCDKVVIWSTESSEGFPLSKGKELDLVFKVPLRLPERPEVKSGALVAVDGVLKHDLVNLAPSTRLTHTQMDNNVGLIISYMIVVKCSRTLGSKLSAEVPFTLSYPTVPVAMRQVSLANRRPVQASGVGGYDDEEDDYEFVGLSEQFAKFMQKRVAGGDDPAPAAE